MGLNSFPLVTKVVGFPMVVLTWYDDGANGAFMMDGAIGTSADANAHRWRYELSLFFTPF